MPSFRILIRDDIVATAATVDEMVEVARDLGPGLYFVEVLAGLGDPGPAVVPSRGWMTLTSREDGVVEVEVAPEPHDRG